MPASRYRQLCARCPDCRVSRLSLLLCLFIFYFSFTLGSYIYASYTLSHVSTLCSALYAAFVVLIVLLVLTYVSALACFCHVYRKRRSAYKRWREQQREETQLLQSAHQHNGIDHTAGHDQQTASTAVEAEEAQGEDGGRNSEFYQQAEADQEGVPRPRITSSSSFLTEALLSSHSEEEEFSPRRAGERQPSRLWSRVRCPRHCDAKRVAIYSAWTLWFLLLSLLFIVCVLTFALVIFLQLHTLPKLTGVLRLPGLEREVCVSRDDSGLIHVQGYRRADVYFAQGVVMMQERMWQMEMQRAIGSGRLQELVGANEQAAEIDSMARLMGYLPRTRDSLAVLDAEARRGLTAFVSGINAYLDSEPPLGLEFFVLRLGRPRPWTLEDVLVWAKLMSFMLSGNMEREMQRWEWQTMGIAAQRIDQLLPSYDTRRFPTILPDGVKGAEGKLRAEEQAEEPMVRLLREQSHLLPAVRASAPSVSALRAVFSRYRAIFGPSHASNSWVVGGSRTYSGHPLLCNDPHLPLMAPSLWILFHLQVITDTSAPAWATEDVIGASLAGVPGVIVGRNNVSSWALTNTGADVQDLFIMQDSADHTQYWHGQRWLNYSFHTETISRKGADDVSFTFRSSLYGPVITDLLSAFPSPLPLSLRWTSLLANDSTVNAFLGINFARDYASFRRSLRAFVAPSQSFLYADRSTIAYQMPGLIPTRVQGHSGKYPVPGDGSSDWTGFLSFEQLPAVVNPQQDWLVTANNQVTNAQWNVTVSADWDEPSDGYRALRIQRLIERQSNHSRESMLRMLADEQSLLFDDFKPLLKQLKLSTDAGRQWQSRLQDFSGVMRAGSEEATVFQLFFSFLCTLPFDEINATNCNPVYLYSVFALGQPEPNCDKYKPPRPPTREVAEEERDRREQEGDETLLRRREHESAAAAAAAPPPPPPRGASPGCLSWASAGFDSVVDGRLSAPLWGEDVKPAVFAHQILSGSPLSCLANRQVPHGGDDFTINVGHYSIDPTSSSFHKLSSVPATLTQQQGPSYRQLVDLSRMNDSLYQPSLGQSGNLISAFYDDTLQDWAKVRLLPMRTTGFERSYVLWLRSDAGGVPDDPNGNIRQQDDDVPVADT